MVMWGLGLWAFAALAGAMPPGPGFPHIKAGCPPSDPRHKDLWCPGDAGYECYKIPSLLRIPGTATLLAFVEARKHSCDDAGFIDLLLRRSLDGGKSWLAPQLVHGNSTEGEWHTIGDALPVYDPHDGAVHVVFTRDNTDAFHTRSSDHGATWAAPRNISASAVRRRGPFLGTGHAGGLWLEGRLLVPMYGGGSGSFMLISEDHGESWRIAGEVKGAPATEWAVAPTKSGRLLGSLRSFPWRLQAYSEDQGESWTRAERKLALPEPVGGCEGALLLHPDGRLYYSHPDRHVLRQRMHIKVSEDEGRTWRQHASIWGPGKGCDRPCVPAASYSSMATLGEGPESEIGLFYMRNNVTMLIFEGTPSFTSFSPKATQGDGAIFL